MARIDRSNFFKEFLFVVFFTATVILISSLVYSQDLDEDIATALDFDEEEVFDLRPVQAKIPKDVPTKKPIQKSDCMCRCVRVGEDIKKTRPFKGSRHSDGSCLCQCRV